MSNGSGSGRALTPRQIKVLDELIAVGAGRPTAPPELVSELQARVETGIAPALTRWTERSLYVTKGQILTALRCEGQLLADAARPRTGSSPAIVVGTVAHRAIQLAYTHQGRPVAEYVRNAVIAARRSDEDLDSWWASAEPAEQSDILVQISSRVTNFLDDFPPLQEAWSPRFEEPVVAKAGKLTLSCRPDLMMGRPRGDLRQTLFILDFKSGDLKDEHLDEARFYALVATLRHGVPPWRSCVYSLASGEYTEPDITPEVLFDTADRVVSAVNSIVDTLAEVRTPLLAPGKHCRYCPARTECPAAEQASLLPTPPTARVFQTV